MEDQTIYLTMTDVTDLIAGKILNPFNVKIVMTEPAREMLQKDMITLLDTDMDHLLKGGVFVKDGVHINFTEEARNKIKELVLKGEDITHISLSDNDFELLVAGKTISWRGEDIEICLQDIGFHRMKDLIGMAEENVTVLMTFKFNDNIIYQQNSLNIPETGQIVIINELPYIIDNLDFNIDKKTCVVHLLKNEYLL